MLKTLAAASGRDHLKVTDAAVPNGMQMKVEVEEGVLRTLFAVYTAWGEAESSAAKAALPTPPVKPVAPPAALPK